MRSLIYLLDKEFRQIFRNRILLRMIMLVPVIQLLILPLAADYEIKNLDISVVDHDRSPYSRELISSIVASGYFRLVEYGESWERALGDIEADRADVILEIPRGFESNLLRESSQKVFLAANAINGVKAGLATSYLGSIIGAFNRDISAELISADMTRAGPVAIPAGRLEVTTSHWYNPHLHYQTFMVPAILVLLVTMIGVIMCALNIVKEKEVGTIEQINVTPIRKQHYILGKLIPFWLIGIVIFTIGFFGISWLVYGIEPLGSIGLVYAYLALYLVAILGFGLLISTYAANQQQAMSIAFFFMMIFILMSGLFTPIESMPPWAQVIAHLIPLTYFMEVIRMVVLKGSGFADVQQQFLIMAGFAVFFNGWAVWSYRKRV